MVDLGKKIDNARELIDFVSQGASDQKQKEEIARKNNVFFDKYNDLFLPLLRSCNAAKKYFDFEIATEHISKIKEISDNVNKCIEQKRVVVRLESFHSNLKNLMSIISKNWDEYFENYSKSIIDNLNVLFQISDPSKRIKISALRKDINSCQKWPITEEKCLRYVNAKNASYALFSSIDFDEEIINFLKKVSLKTATLSDITDSILKWIEKENLEDKIILSIKV